MNTRKFRQSQEGAFGTRLYDKSLTSPAPRFSDVANHSGEKRCVLLSNTVRPWPAGLSVPHEELQSIQSRRLIYYCRPLCQKGEAPSVKREVAAVGDRQLHTLQSSNPTFGFALKQIYKPNDGSTHLSVIQCLSMRCISCSTLTFSSIPPLMTGSGSGPASVRETQK